MCGIAGVIDLASERVWPTDLLHAMADAIVHRGPDEDGYFQQEGVHLANRRLSIVGLADGRQPISNETNDVHVVFNGELFDYPEQRKFLEAKGHRFRTHCDTELFPHLWEEFGEEMFAHLHGQYAVVLFDRRQKRIVLARDRFGICPLYWARRGDWLIFGSEIKAILASGSVSPEPNLRGINHVFTFFSMPGPLTCFEGIQSLLPGRYLDLRTESQGRRTIRERVHWQIDFPDAGKEDYVTPVDKLVDRFEERMLASVERRLRAEVPVVSYLSGGVDSSLIVALASKIRGTPLPTFTVRVEDPQLDETSEAGIVARHLGCQPHVVNFGSRETLSSYPRLIWAAEGPVIDTSCAAMLLLARDVHQHGYKVALTGEGSDEFLAGYSWFKIHKALSFFDFIPGFPLSMKIRRLFLKLAGSPTFPMENVKRTLEAVGGSNAWLDLYGMFSTAKLRFYSPHMREVMTEHNPYADLGLNTDRIKRWHPLNRSLYLGTRVHLPGSLLNGKGDRVAMHHSVETRYPFLDDEVFEFLASVDPGLKLRGFRDKYLLRRLAERYLPKEIAWRRKAMFRAPFDSFHLDPAPRFVEQLFSEESLRKTGYFDVPAVLHWRKAFKEMRLGSTTRTSVEMGLAGVLSTQLWHHLFIDASLAELPLPGSFTKTVGTQRHTTAVA